MSRCKACDIVFKDHDWSEHLVTGEVEQMCHKCRSLSDEGADDLLTSGTDVEEGGSKAWLT